jgi:hypothetical protein
MVLFRYAAEIRHLQKKILGWARTQRASYRVSSASSFDCDLVCANYDILLVCVHIHVCMYVPDVQSAG